MTKSVRVLILICILTAVCGWVSLPQELPISFSLFGKPVSFVIGSPKLHLSVLGKPIDREFVLKKGLDIQGGMQVVLGANMSEIAEADRETALESAREVIARRVDLYGIAEPSIQTSRFNDDYRILVELPGVDDPGQALELVGRTAELSFKLEGSPSAEATTSAVSYFNNFSPTQLSGKNLKKATVQFDPKTGEPVIGLEFTPEGKDLFAAITKAHVNEVLGIFIDDFPVALPRINTPILDGQAVMTGGFTLESAKQLSVQLNAGALPVPIEILEQRTVGASLGQDSVSQSVKAGLVGLGLVILFMVLYYGLKGVLAGIALGIYAVITIAVYKTFGVTITVPGIAGLLLSVGMAVDSNILIFERIKEELRNGRQFDRALELGFGRAWDSIKDANVTTIVTALLLINPLNVPFLNTSGLVRGFGITLLLGVLISLFTGIVVTRTLMRLFLKGTQS